MATVLLTTETLTALFDGVTDEFDIRGAIAISGTLAASGVIVVTISGDVLDFIDGSKVLLAVCKRLMPLTNHCILNLPACPYVSSMGLAGLARLAASGMRNGFKICVVGVDASFRQLLHQTNFTKIIMVDDPIESALARLLATSLPLQGVARAG
jgi:anti-anti-sigma factor